MSEMRAMVITRYGDPDVLQSRRVPIPTPRAGEVIVRVRAFGVNHAEIYFRRGVWGKVAAISGIECAGEVHDPGTTNLRRGQRVFALMGGMGRAIDGSYAEYVRVPEVAVAAIDSALDWVELAALPESYATAWELVANILEVAPAQTLLVRGGTSALGQAAIRLARARGAVVFATTRTAARREILAGLGAEPVLAAPELARDLRGLDAVLDLIGTSTLLDSLGRVRRGGRVAMAGFLGGGEPIAAFDPLRHMPSGVHLAFFASAFVFGTVDYPVARIPFAALIADHHAPPAHVFDFERIADAHRLVESGEARGKVVVRVG